jgi:crotonobetainyl-CoA:carnitine CoA-transferase CaiB-like acyl-CoA transferase
MAVERQGPLKGMKVIEMCHVMAGPTCGMMLADMGADVIKVEKPEGGDDTRKFAPPLVNGESAAFMMMNRNKRGIVLDLKSEGGKQVLWRLLETADVLTENYRPGVLARMGFDYESLRQRNPGLIYAAISGFGRSGPYAERAGLDLIAQGMSGLMSVTGEGPGRPPVKVAAPVCDITAGLLLAMGVSAAYAHRLKTGQGQMLDTSLYEAGITHSYWQSAIALATGVAPQPIGSAHPLNAPYQALACKDGYITLGASNLKLWGAMLKAMGVEHLSHDPRFADAPSRLANRMELAAELEKTFTQFSRAEVLERLEQAGVPSGPIYDMNEMHRDPQTLARQMLVPLDHPVAGRTHAVGLPVKFADTPGRVVDPAPVFGQHTAEVLAEYGYGPEEIEKLAADKAVLLGEVNRRAAAE